MDALRNANNFFLVEKINKQQNLWSIYNSTEGDNKFMMGKERMDRKKMR